MSPTIWRLVGFLAAVEIASGILQGYYTPVYSDIADHLVIADGDVNWFEAAQLIVAALAVPVLSRLGDLHGHRRVLILATVVTAVGGWVVAFAPGFWTFLVGWALQGAYTVWLPMEIAILHERARDRPDPDALVRRGAALLVLALEVGVIVGALGAGALAPVVGMTTVMLFLLLMIFFIKVVAFLTQGAAVREIQAIANDRAILASKRKKAQAVPVPVPVPVHGSGGGAEFAVIAAAVAAFESDIGIRE